MTNIGLYSLQSTVLDGWHNKCPSQLQWKLIQKNSSIFWKERIWEINYIRFNNNYNNNNPMKYHKQTDLVHSLFLRIFNQSNWLKHQRAQMVSLNLFWFIFEVPLSKYLTCTVYSVHYVHVQNTVFIKYEPFNHPIFKLNEYFLFNNAFSFTYVTQ